MSTADHDIGSYLTGQGKLFFRLERDLGAGLQNDERGLDRLASARMRDVLIRSRLRSQDRVSDGGFRFAFRFRRNTSRR